MILGDQPTPVCSLVRHADPAGAASELSRVFPYPVPAEYDAAVIVAPGMLKRLEGTIQMVPDDDAKIWLQRRRIGRVVGTFFFCVTPQGTVDVVVVSRPTGVPRYDERIGATVRRWRFAPFLVDGQAAPACTHVAVVYSQR